MKSTYKLLNIYLDGQPLPAQIPKMLNAAEMPEYYELEEEMNIFDFPICRRKISGMKLLTYQSETEIYKEIKTLPDCKELIIILDYKSTSKSAHELYLKRILQAVYLITKCHPDLTVTFTGHNDEYTIKQIYQNQTQQ